MKSIHMKNDHTMEELITLEQREEVWKENFLGYPLWIHFREDLIKNGIKADRKMYIPSLFSMLKSMYSTFVFLVFQQHTKPHTYFLMERAELLESYIHDDIDNKVLFLNPEQEQHYTGKYISADFFNLMRYLSRKSAFFLAPFKYRYFVDRFDRGLLDMPEIQRNVQNAMGDALFLYLLDKLLRSDYKKFYSGCVIPIGEKFLNRLNSVEIQHGIIHEEHVGYIGIPSVKNTLMLYHDKYAVLLKNKGYQGNIVINPYKNVFFERESSRYFPIVIYTQPLAEMQEALKAFFLHYKGEKDIYIQKHPKDYAEYSIEKKYIIHSSTPNEVAFPIFFTSSAIENFTLFNRDCYIWNVSQKIKSDDILKIFLIGSLSHIYTALTIDDVIKQIRSDQIKKLKGLA